MYDGAELVRRVVDGLQNHPTWTASDHRQYADEAALGAGRRHDIAWSGYAPHGHDPDTIVHGDQVLLEGILSLDSIGWKRSGMAFDKVVRPDQKIRFPLVDLMANNPSLLPMNRVVEYIADVSELQLGDATVVDVTCPEGGSDVVTVAVDGSTWTFGFDPFSVHITGWRMLPLTIEFADGPLPFTWPGDDDVVDVERLRQIAPEGFVARRSRKAPSPLVQIEPSEDEDNQSGWTVRGDNLDKALGVSSCVAVEQLVQQALAAGDTALDGPVEFDSELSCFFADCRSEDDAIRLARLIDGLAPKRTRRRSKPGAG